MYDNICTSIWRSLSLLSCFFFNDTATTEIYTLSLHDALPIFFSQDSFGYSGSFLFHINFRILCSIFVENVIGTLIRIELNLRSEEHTSELQSRQYLVCRLLLEKKNNKCLYLS